MVYGAALVSTSCQCAAMIMIRSSIGAAASASYSMPKWASIAASARSVFASFPVASKPSRLTRIDLGKRQSPDEHEVFESLVIGSGRSKNYTRDRRDADPDEDGGKPGTVVGDVQPVAIWKPMQIGTVFEIPAPMVISVIFSVSRICHPSQKLGYPFRTIGKDGGDQTLTRPAVQQNGAPRVSDPSLIAGKGATRTGASFPHKKGDRHKTSVSSCFVKCNECKCRGAGLMTWQCFFGLHALRRYVSTAQNDLPDTVQLPEEAST